MKIQSSIGRRRYFYTLLAMLSVVVFSGVFTEVASAQGAVCPPFPSQWKITITGYSLVLGRIGVAGHFVNSTTGVPYVDNRGLFSADGTYGPYTLGTNPGQPYNFAGADITLLDGNGNPIFSGGTYSGGDPTANPPTGVYYGIPVGTTGWCMNLTVDNAHCPWEVKIDFYPGPC